MNKYIKSGLLATCAVLSLSATLASCSKDGESVEDLMVRNYPTRVYLQGDRYSAPLIHYTLKHTAESGVTGDAEGRISVKLTRATGQDVVVGLKLEVENKEVENAFLLSTQEVVVKAGQTASEEVILSVDRSALSARDAMEEYRVSVVIDTLKSAPEGVGLSVNQNLYTATFSKSAKSEDALLMDQEYDGLSLIDDRSAFSVINITEGVENANVPRILLGGGSDLATNRRAFAFTVDMGSVLPKLNAIYVTYWGDDYAPQSVQVEISEDGTQWTNLGEADLLTAETKGFIRFKKPYAARYVRYTILVPATRTSVTGFYAYVEDELGIGGGGSLNPGGGDEDDDIFAGEDEDDY